VDSEPDSENEDDDEEKIDLKAVNVFGKGTNQSEETKNAKQNLKCADRNDRYILELLEKEMSTNPITNEIKHN
jgi:hypothetical protein